MVKPGVLGLGDNVNEEFVPFPVAAGVPKFAVPPPPTITVIFDSPSI
jgi:hypothetical protein